MLLLQSRQLRDCFIKSIKGSCVDQSLIPASPIPIDPPRLPNASPPELELLELDELDELLELEEFELLELEELDELELLELEELELLELDELELLELDELELLELAELELLELEELLELDMASGPGRISSPPHAESKVTPASNKKADLSIIVITFLRR